MSVWDDVVGQEAATAILKQAVKAAGEMVAAGVGLGIDADSSAVISGGMTHAWLITGPPGSGRSTAARAFAAALQCLEGGCGTCHSCQTALSGAHADVSLISTEHVQLRVDDVRPLIQLAQRSPSEGRWRVVVIEDADRLNDSSGNVLLKAVEEPPPRTVWLLCAPSADDVLTTIRSRCRRIGLRIPPVSDVAELLVRRDGADPAIASFAARSAQSHIGLARRLALDEDARIRRREVLKLPLKLRSVGAAVLAAGELVEVCAEESKASTTERDATEKAALLRSLGAEGLSTLPPAVRTQVKQLEENQKRRATRSQRDVLDRSLIDLLSLYRDVLVLQLGEGRSEGIELVNAEMADLIRAEARNSSAASTLRRMEAIGQARERIEANVSPLLALESLMVQLRPAAA
ncbi:DNA polymerase III subunit delta' [Kineosporia babensis]|uniref:DNA polymerase III subunit delta n=1 Tax=Kineosporia babensis TaxID=499548 RepID=A0A9X1NFM8_9ACTN|nr:DNA polymerase III subunit delta' [Kineosporia babensis]MCD5312709.1 DNA polymerase III subunit delta' [Kineosporia babensis]